MKSLTVAVALCAVLLSTTGCAWLGWMSGPRHVQLTAADDGRAVELAVGQRLGVSLEGNPSTGYAWAVDELDPSVLEQVGEFAFEADSDAVGAGGILTGTFAAVAPGQTALKLVYARPWETDVDPLEIFEVRVTVR